MEKLSPRVYSVDGTPTDCVNLGVNGILRGKKIDLLVSGINKGANLGDDITYSGTVSAAMEGTLQGIPSIAVSLVTRTRFRFDTAAAMALDVARKVLKRGLPDDTLLNVNVPNAGRDEIKGVRVTRMGKRVYGDQIVEKRDPRGRKYYWIGGDHLNSEDVPGSDLEAIEEGFISVTPIHLDLRTTRPSGPCGNGPGEGALLRRRMVEEQIRRAGDSRRARPFGDGRGAAASLRTEGDPAPRLRGRPSPHRGRADDLPTVHRRRDDGRAPAFGHGEGPRDRERLGVPDGDPCAPLPRAGDDRGAPVPLRRGAEGLPTMGIGNGTFAVGDGSLGLPGTRRSTGSSPPRRRRPSPPPGSPN